MEETVSHVRERANEFNQTDSPIANTIHSHLSKFNYDEFQAKLQDLQIAINSFQKDIEQSDLDNVHARGFDDAIESIDNQLAHVAGRFNSSRKVIAAGAGPHKAAEYLDHSADSLSEAYRQLESTLTHAEKVADDADEGVDYQDVEVAGDNALTDIDVLKTHVNNASDELN